MGYIPGISNHQLHVVWNYIFASFWTWLGAFILVSIVVNGLVKIVSLVCRRR